MLMSLLSCAGAGWQAIYLLGAAVVDAAAAVAFGAQLPDTADSIKGKVSVLKYFSRDQHCKPYCVCSIFSDCSPKWDDIAKRFAHLLALHQNRAIDYYLPRPVFLLKNGHVVKDKEGEMIWNKVSP